ncbi:MAG: hypothetical protein DCF30_03695 [Hyphomicrobiales bacterium]|nr:MAG: hypothetical protein DCF30_03695 [Hyphomicrobiales bacterium]
MGGAGLLDEASALVAAGSHEDDDDVLQCGAALCPEMILRHIASKTAQTLMWAQPSIGAQAG